MVKSQAIRIKHRVTRVNPPGCRREPDFSVAVRPLETKLVLAERPGEPNKLGTGLMVSGSIGEGAYTKTCCLESLVR